MEVSQREKARVAAAIPATSLRAVIAVIAAKGDGGGVASAVFIKDAASPRGMAPAVASLATVLAMTVAERTIPQRVSFLRRRSNKALVTRFWAASSVSPRYSPTLRRLWFSSV